MTLLARHEEPSLRGCVLVQLLVPFDHMRHGSADLCLGRPSHLCVVEVFMQQRRSQ